MRRRQWLGALRSILDARDDHEPVKYLGLPGIDLLDLRLIYSDVCVATGRGLDFFGIDEAAGPGTEAEFHLAVSKQELKLRPGVGERSDVKHGNFADLSSTKTIVYRDAAEHAPFDVVNVDLCNSVLSDAPGGRTKYGALQQIFDLQSSRRLPWVLLLTTSMDGSGLDPSAGQMVLTKHIAVLNEVAGLRERLGAIGIRSDLAEGLTIAECSVVDRAELLVLGVLEWLASRAQDRGERAHVKGKSVLGYRVMETAAEHDMFSIALEVRPKSGAGADPDGLGRTGASFEFDPLKTFEQLGRQLRNRRDVDEAVRDDAALRASLIAETADLLAAARYSRVAYHDWVAGYQS